MKNRSHPIPKYQQIPQTPGIQLVMVYLYLEGKPYNKITNILDSHTKREWRKMGVDLKETKTMEGRAVERRVKRLFKGGVNIRGKWYERLPLFDRLPNRTGQPFHNNELRCIQIAIKWKRDIDMISRLTGREKEELQEKLNKNTKSLFD